MLLMRCSLLGASAAMMLAAGLSGCGGTCSSEMLASQNAPGGRQARLVRNNCGATSGFSYEVRLSVPGDAPQSGTVVLRFDSNHALNWPQDEAGVVRLSWQGDQRLDVTLARPVRVFKLRDRVNGVTIHFALPRGSEL